jgi:hypothetical protein
MRLSDWLAGAPHAGSAAPKVVAVIEPMLAMLGADADPDCWVAWGDDPAMRYTVFAATDAGLAQVIVRVNVPGEGPRAGGKLIRWNRVQLGDLAVEMQGGHRILSIPLEGVILRGTDETADQVAAFVLDALAAIDGRPRGDQRTSPARMSSGKAGTKSGAKAGPKAVPLGPSGAAPRRRPVPLLEGPKGPTS